jgi:hypothetical protein
VVAAGGGSGKAATGKSDTLVPGSAVSGVMVQGDISIQGTGTLTYLDGETALAFGHAMLLYGDVQMPLAEARIVTTVASDALSFKVGYPERVIGAWTRDNQTALAGRLGAQAPMIPVRLVVKRGGTTKKYNFEVFRNKVFTSLMIGASITNALVGTPSYDAEGTVRVDGLVRLEDHPTLNISGTYFDLGPSGMHIPSISAQIGDMLRAVLNNPLAPARVKNIELTMVEEPGRQAVRIETAWVDKAVVRAGETLTVYARVRAHQGAAQVHTMRLLVPPGTPSGELSVVVTEAQNLEAAEGVDPYKVTDLTTLIERLNERRSQDAIYARLTRSAAGTTVKGVALAGVPPSVLSVVRGGGAGQQDLTEVPLAEASLPVGARVAGEVKLKLTVR